MNSHDVITNPKDRNRAIRACNAHIKAIRAFHDDRADDDKIDETEKKLARSYDMETSKLPVQRSKLAQLSHNALEKVREARDEARTAWQSAELLDRAEHFAKLAQQLEKLYVALLAFTAANASLN